MSIKAIEIHDIPGRAYKDCKVQKDIFEFVKSEWPACEVDISCYKNAESARQAYKSSADHLGVAIIPMSRNGRLFLIRGNQTEE
jgi:hypothetical protein